MAQRLATLIKRTSEYRQLVRNRRLSNREVALVQLSVRVAEEHLGDLRVELANREGDLKVSQQQTKFAVFLGAGGRLVNGSLNFLLTPFSEMPDLYLKRGDSPRLLTSGNDESPESAVATRTTDSEGEVKDDTSTAVPSKKAASASSTANAESFISGLPKWLQSILMFTRDRLATLSPATTAILFILSITAAIYYGEYSKARIEESYRLAVQDAKTYRSQAERVPQLEAEVGQLKLDVTDLETSKTGLETQVSTLGEQITQSEQDLSEERAAITTLRDAHNQELANLRGNLEASTREKIERLETDNRNVQVELQEARADRDFQFKQLQVTKSQLDVARQRLADEKKKASSLRVERESQDGRLDELENVESDYISLRAFTRDVVGLLKEYLLESSTKYITQNRKEFKEKYRSVYDREAELFSDLSLKRF